MAKPKTLSSIFNSTFKDPPKKESKKKKDPAMKPSMLGSPCFRKIYYSYNNVETDFGFELKNKRIMKLGDYISDMLNDSFRDAGILIDYKNPDGTYPMFFGKENREFPVTAPELGIKSGKIDAIIKLEKKVYISEYKSINSRGFKGGVDFQGNAIPALSGPKINHLVQGVVYLYLFNENLKAGAYKHIPELDGVTEAEGVIFLYYCKDTSEIKEYLVTNADNIFSQIITRIVFIMDATKNKVLPPKTPDYCGSCQYRTKCGKDFNDI